MTFPDGRARLKPVGHTPRSPVNKRPRRQSRRARGALAKSHDSDTRDVWPSSKHAGERKTFPGLSASTSSSEERRFSVSIANQREQRMKVLRTRDLTRIIVSDFYEGGSSGVLLFGKSYSSFSPRSAMHRKRARRKALRHWPKLCSWSAVAWRLKATFAFTIHFPMTETGATWIRCVAPAAAVDPRVVRGRSPPLGEATRVGLWIGVLAHRLPQAVQA
jgi:hypothetical protein